MDKCENCERTIGKLETPFVLHERVVCRECYGRLVAQAPPVPQANPALRSTTDAEPGAAEVLADLERITQASSVRAPVSGGVGDLGAAIRAPSRACPFCRQAVDPRASRCPHCSAEIGRLQDCVQCPSCREMVCPVKVVATNEKGFWTDLAKIDMGGGAFLPSTEETYTACPVCKKPIAYCSRCCKVTTSELSRNWVGIGRTKSGYQYSTLCSCCGKKISGPSCFVATEVFGTTLDANLLTLYNLRDNCIAHSQCGRVLILAYYRIGPALASCCKSHPAMRRIIGAFIGCVIRVYRYRLEKSRPSTDNVTASGRPRVRPG